MLVLVACAFSRGSRSRSARRPPRRSGPPTGASDLLPVSVQKERMGGVSVKHVGGSDKCPEMNKTNLQQYTKTSSFKQNNGNEITPVRAQPPWSATLRSEGVRSPSAGRLELDADIRSQTVIYYNMTYHTIL